MSNSAATNEIAQLDVVELRRRVADLSTLVEVTKALAAEQNLDRLLTVITQEACRALGSERASLYFLDEQRQELYTKIATQLEIAEIRTSIHRGITGWVARHRRIANVPDPSKDPRWNFEFDRRTGFHTRSILAAPLVSAHDRRLLGVLQLINKRDGTFDHYDEQLLEAFSSHAALALERARLLDEFRAKRHLELSLEIARDVQAHFFPRRLPELPTYELAGWSRPAEATGGDYYDVLPLEDDRLGLAIADVSGHGLGPSLLMASVRATLRGLALAQLPPEEVVGRLGTALFAELSPDRFVTLIYAVLDARLHRLRYASAGHTPILHYQLRERRFSSLEATGVPLGLFERHTYPAGPIAKIEPGDLVLLFTDGVIEAVDLQRRPFGLRRVCDLLAELATRPCRELADSIGQAVAQHRGDQPLSDDLTLLLVRRRP